MDYKQVVQTSKPIEYGEQKEFSLQEDALKRAKKIQENVKTELALMKLYELSKVEIIHIENAYQVKVTISIPDLFKLNNRNEKKDS